MNKIEMSLLQNKNIKRKSKQLTVKIICTGWDGNTIHNLFMNMFHLFDAMKTVKQWKDIRFVLALEGPVKLDTTWVGVKKILNELEMIKEDYLIEYGEAKPELFKSNNGKQF